MTLIEPAAIVGVGMSRFETTRNDVNLSELYREGAELALRDAGLSHEDPDLVVVAQAPDALHGNGHPEQLVPEALARQDVAMMRVHTGGATGASAVQAAWWAVASGRHSCALVLGAEKMGDNVRGAQQVLNKIWDPAYEAAMPLNTISMSALATSRRMQWYGETPAQYAAIAERLRKNGALNPHAHLRTEVSAEQIAESDMLCTPITKGMSCPRSSGACAVIVASQDFVRRLSTPPAWIRGCAARTNTYWIGDRMGAAGDNQYGRQHELRLACAEAYEMAGVREPHTELDAVEPYVPFSPLEPSAIEAMGLCEPGMAASLAEDGAWDIDGRVAVCPSGGVLCANPISVSAMVRVAEAAQQVRARAGEHQVDGARTAAAVGAGGSNQFFVAFVLGASMN